MRTVEEFFEDLVSDGHDWKYIIAVSIGTRWWPYRERLRELWDQWEERKTKKT